MNFLIFDNGLSSSNLINTLLNDFNHVTLITTNASSTLSSSSFLTIKPYDITNASQVLDSLSNQENDPFDAILLFNLSLYTGVHNIIQALKRLQCQLPSLFLFNIGQQNEFDKNTNKLLKESSESIQWTIVICNEINASTNKKYRIETKAEPTNQQPIASSDFLDFLLHELKTKQYLNEIICLYSY